MGSNEKSILQLIQAGDHHLARQKLHRHLEQHPDDARAWYAMALTLDDRSEQVKALRRSLKADPQFGPARQRLDKLLATRSARPSQRTPAILLIVGLLALLGLFAAIGIVLLDQQADPTPPAVAAQPTDIPTDVPTDIPTDPPTESPTEPPTDTPTEEPTEAPTQVQVRILRPADDPDDAEPTTEPVDLPPAVIIPVEEAAPEQMVIRFDPAASAEERAAYVDALGGTVMQNIASLDTVVVSLPTGALENAIVIPPMSEDVAPVALATERDFYISAQVEPQAPSDPRYAEQWALPVIRAPHAWSELTDAAPLVVAVIDSGICASHPDLAGRVVAGWDFVEDDANPQDEFGHGCAIAGIIAANTDDGIGIAGVAPHVQIMPLRVLDGSGLGLYSDVAAAIVHAVDNGAHIINLSAGGAHHAAVLQEAINYALNQDVLVIAAAGNTGQPGVLYPAAYPGVVAVGSVDSNLERSSFSSTGPEIELLAPGRDILAPSLNGDYALKTGTSFAVPHVTGVAALEMAIGSGLVRNGGVVAFSAVGGSDDILILDPGDGTQPLRPGIDFEPVILEGMPSGTMLIEGDIVVPLNFYEMRAQGAYTSASLWTNGIVPYTFAPGTTVARQQAVVRAMDGWEAVSGVRFVPYSGHTNWIEFIAHPSASFSCVGMGGNCWWGAPGKQQINLAETWGWQHDTIIHEIGHALGLWHEQSRMDRDNYVRIEWDRILDGMQHNFATYSNGGDHGPYDFDSIMHYPDTAFTATGQPTITVLPPNQHKQNTIGRPWLLYSAPLNDPPQKILSAGDRAVMAFLYPPPYPTLISPANGITTNNPRPTFRWNSVPGATVYQIHVTSASTWTGGATVNVTGTQWTWSNNLSNLTYRWRVRAFRYGAWTDWSTGRLFTVDTIPPAPPSLLGPPNGSTVENTRPTFQWSAPATATAYQLQVTSTGFSSAFVATINTSSTQHTWGSDLGNRTYEWRVRARDAAGNWSAWSSISSVTIVRPAVPPTLIAPANAITTSNLRPTFSWTSVPGASVYQLHVTSANTWTGGAIINVTGTQWTWSNNLSNLTYRWRVRSYVDGVWSDWSTGRIFTVNSTPPPPTLVAPANAITSSNPRPTFSWTSVPGASVYQLHVTSASTWTGGATINVTGTQWTWSNNLSNLTYRWRVRAFANGQWSDWSTGRIFTVDNAPAPPVLIAPANAVTTFNLRPTFSWTSLPGATQYQIHVTSASTWTGGATINVTGTQWTWSNNLSNLTYRWRVRGLVNGVWSQWSTGRLFTVDGTPPEPFYPFQNLVSANQRPRFWWYSKDNATSYQLQVTSTGFDSPYVATINVGTNHYSWASNLAHNRTYQWRIRARDAIGQWSPWSAIRNVSINYNSNDNFDTPHVIATFLPYSSHQYAGAATTAGDDPTFTCVSGQRYRTLWYRYTPSSSEWVTVDTFGSDYDTVLAVWTGSRGSLSSMGCNDDAAGTFQSRLSVYMVAGTTYHIEVASFGTFANNLQLNIASGYVAAPDQPVDTDKVDDSLPTGTPTLTEIVTALPTITETVEPVETPTDVITSEPTAETPTDEPVVIPTEVVTTEEPTAAPTNTPVPPTATSVPTQEPTLVPTDTPVPPTETPIPTNTPVPPTNVPTDAPPADAPTDPPPAGD